VEKGLGGRHSDGGFTVAVFGGTGQIGRNLLTRMGREGIQGVMPHRTKDKKVIHYKLMADLGQFNFINFYEIRDDEATEQIVKHSDVIVNCIGRTYPTRNYALDEVHVTWPDKLSKICRKYNKERLVHLSAYGASSESELPFLRLKAAGEKAVKKNFPEAVIVRPARVFGRTDDYLTLMRFVPHMWGNVLIGKRWSDEKPILKMPIHIGDVGQAVLNACRMPKINGETFELLGNEAFYLDDLQQFVYEVMMGIDRDSEKPDDVSQIRHVPVGVLKAFSRVSEMIWFMGKPPLDQNIIDLNHLTEVPTGLPGLKDLGIEQPQGKLSEIVLDILRPFRPYGKYYETMNQATLPTPVNVEEYMKSVQEPQKRIIVGNLNKSLI